MKDDIITVSIPYSNVVWGDVLLQCEKPSDVSREDFIKGIQNWTIDPWDFVAGCETWVDYDSDDPQVSYEEAKESK